MKSVIKFIKNCFIKIILISILFFSVSYRILDPKAKNPNALLKKIAPQLDKLNINVVQDWNSKIKTDNRNAIIAPLANWPGQKKEEFTTGWVKDLKNGLHAGYAALRYKKKLSPKEMPAVWNRINKNQRVFISFTRADIKVAEELRKVLESEGYKVFTYINAGEINQSYEEVGRIMSTAGKHFVIDSYNSRISQGVIAEALTHTTYVLKYPKVEITVLSDKTPRLVKYDENKIKFIDAMVTSGIPIIISGKEPKLLYFDPAITTLGSFLQNAIVKINGEIIEDPLLFSSWTNNILGDRLSPSKESFSKNANYYSKEKFEEIVSRTKKNKTDYNDMQQRLKLNEELLKRKRKYDIDIIKTPRRRIR